MNITTVCNYTCDVTGIKLWDNPLLMIAGIVALILVMIGILKLIQWVSIPCHDP